MNDNAIGAANVGHRVAHPLVDTFSAFSVTNGTAHGVVAYLQLPSSAGSYDVCVSPKTFRQSSFVLKQAAPVWFKAFRFSGAAACELVSPLRFVVNYCASTLSTSFDIVAVDPNPTTWSMRDETQQSWGPISFTGTDLNSGQVVEWDCKGCTSKNYLYPTGGDMFRLVKAERFPTDYTVRTLPITWAVSTGGTSFAAQTYLERRRPEAEDGRSGTATTLGCWHQAEDNYGKFGFTFNRGVDNATADADLNGPTASGNLGADQRAQLNPWLVDLSGTTITAAYIRVPAMINSQRNDFYVCYRKSGTQSWRVLSYGGSVARHHPRSLKPAQFRPVNQTVTYSFNDTRALTSGELLVRAKFPIFATTPSNLLVPTSQATDSQVRSVAMRVVLADESCETGVALPDAASSDPGLPECSPATCGFSGTCGFGKCYGRADDVAFLRRDVAFFFKVPPVLSIGYRVCVKINLLNWNQIALLVPAAAPPIAYRIADRTAGTLALVSFSMTSVPSTDKSFDARAVSAINVGDMARIIPMTVNGVNSSCDLSWNPSSANYYRSQDVVSAVGANCSGFSTGPCSASVLNPTDGGVSGYFPFGGLNMTAQSILPSGQGSVAFIALPADLTQPYKVCYRQARRNWFEVPSVFGETLFRTQQPPQCSASPLAGVVNGALVAGTLSSVRIVCSGFKFIPQSSLFKLALRQCGDVAAGNPTPHALYSTLVYPGVPTGSSSVPIWTNASGFTNDNALLTNVSQVYFTAPYTESTGATFRICFMPLNGTSTAANTNWIDLGPVSVSDSRIRYAATSTPLHRAAATITFNSPAVILNTVRGFDAAKVVPVTSFCFATGDDVPRGQTSIDLITGNETGMVDLGTSDVEATTTSELRITFPASSSLSVCYKVCYKRTGMPWAEVYRAVSARSGLCAIPPSVTTLSLSTDLFARNWNSTPGSTRTTSVIGGTSTAWSYSLGNTLTADSSPVGTGDRYFATVVQVPTSGDRLKLVRSARVIGETINYFTADCASDSTLPLVSLASVSSRAFIFDMPAEAGWYMLCYQQSGSTSWLSLDLVEQTNTSAIIANPIQVVLSNQSFVATQSGGTLRVVDTNYVIALDGTALSLSSLAATDRVYITLANLTCGIGGAFTSSGLQGTIASNTQALVVASNPSSTGTLMSRREITPNSLFIPSAKGFFKVCLYKTQDVQTVTTTARAPLQRNMWYHLPNTDVAGSLGGGTPFLSTDPPASVAITCPSGIVPYGSSIEVRAQLLSLTGLLSSPGYTVKWQLIARSAADSFSPNSAGSCQPADATSFGIPRNNSILQSIDPEAVFSAVLLRQCPSGSCQVYVTTDSGISSPTCSFSVTSATVSSLSVSAPSSCTAGSPCAITVTALDATGSASFASAEAVTVSSTVAQSLSLMAFAATTVPLSQGIANFTAVPTLSSTAQPTVIVSITFTVTGVTPVTVSVTIVRPTVAAFLVADIFSVAADGSRLASVEVPSWEPTLSSSGSGRFLPSANVSSATLASPTSGHYLVAGVYYNLTIQVVDSRLALLGSIPSDLTLTLSFGTGSNASANNRLIRLPTATTLRRTPMPSYDDALVRVAATTAVVNISFRIKSSMGCRSDNGGCVLTVSSPQYPNVPVASIRTFVRSKAATLQVTCANHAGQVMVNQCPSLSIERGATLTIRAQDPFGHVDEYFEGNVTLSAFGSITRAAKFFKYSVTSVGDFGAVLPTFTATRGVATVSGVTLNRVCAEGCPVTVASNWGTGVTLLSLVVTEPSTVRLRCALESSLNVQLAVSNVTLLPPAMLNTTTIPQALVYSDTELCFKVWAANDLGDPTLYQSHWVGYTVAPVGSTTTSLSTKNTQLLSRQATLQKSQARFCFLVQSSSAVQFTTVFSVQRFGSVGSSWTFTSAGTCTIGTFQLRTVKIPARLVVDQVQSTTLQTLPISRFAPPTSALWLWATHTLPLDGVLTRQFTADVSLSLVDHYGAAVSKDDASTFFPVANIVLRRCTPSQLAVGSFACQSNSQGTGTGFIEVNSTLPAQESGLVLLQTEGTSTALSGPVVYRLRIAQFCILCKLSFAVWDINGAIPVDSRFGAFTASVSLSLLLPDAGVTRYVAFPFLRSPLNSSSWALRTASATTATGSDLTLYATDCMSGATSCQAPSTQLLQASCDTRAAANNVKGLKFIVLKSLSTTSPLENGRSVCGSSANVACGSNNVVNQVDLFASYSLRLSVGSQVLRCAVPVAGCTDDFTTKVTTTLSPIDTSDAQILVALESATETPYKEVELVGVLPSAAGEADAATNKLTNAPSFNGALVVEATSSTPGVTVQPFSTATMSTLGSFAVAWRPSSFASKVVVRPVADASECFNPPTYLTAATNDGHQTNATLQATGFSYVANDLRPRVPFPIVVDVADGFGNRVFATGTMTVSKEAAPGCNTGGDLVVVGGAAQPIVNGRAVFWLSTTTACQNCQFIFTASTTSTSAWSKTVEVPAALVGRSRQVSIRSDRDEPPPNAVVVTSPATALPSSAKVGDTLSVQVELGTLVGTVYAPSKRTDVTATVRAYNRVRPQPNAIWNGNGGVLRLSSQESNQDRHAVSWTLAVATGRATLSFAFQRTCAACEVDLQYSIQTTAGDVIGTGTITLKNSAATTIFSVTTVGTLRAVVGVPAPIARTRAPFAITTWYVGPNSAGVGTTAAIAPSPLVYVDVANPANGDGGRARSILLPTFGGSTETWLVTMSGPCALCQFRLTSADGGAAASTPLQIATTATHLRVRTMSPSVVLSGLSSSISSSLLTAALYAADDSGFVDVTIGGPTDCSFYLPFQCRVTAAAASVVLSADGQSAGGFPLAADTITTGGTDPSLVVSSRDQAAVNGIVPQMTVTFSHPIRALTPIFSIPSAGLSTTNATRYRAVVDVVDGTSSPDLSLLTPISRFTHHTLTPLIVPIALGRRVNGASTLTPAYTALVNTTSVTATASATCLGLDLNPVVIPLVRGLGYATFQFVKASPSTCVITFAYAPVPGERGCSSCTTSVEVLVSAPTPTAALWVRPTALDNVAESLPGPLYAVAGRRQFLELQARATVAGVFYDSPCDGCTLTVTAGISCLSAPRMSPSSKVTFDTSGKASMVLSWPTATTPTTKTCPLELTAKRSDGTVVQAETRTVTVCTPFRFQVTNMTSTSLSTGVSYPFLVRLVDSTGTWCRGDSQEDATRLSLLAVSQSSTDYAGVVVNSNADGVTGLTSTGPTNAVHAVGGQFRFNVVFTKPHPALRLRVQGRSMNPFVDATGWSQQVAVSIVANALSFRPDSRPPRYLVAGRTNNVQTIHVARAADSVPDSLVSFDPDIPNLDGGFYDSFAEVVVDPLPSPFPLKFNSGGRLNALDQRFRETQFSFNFTGGDGTYRVSLRDDNGELATSAAVETIIQTPAAFALPSLVGPSLCTTTNCAVPEANTTVVNGQVFLSLFGRRAYSMTVAIVDKAGSPVLGDSSVLGLRLTPADSSVQLSTLPTLVDASTDQMAPLLTNMVNGAGVVRFRLVPPKGNVTGAFKLALFCPRLSSSVPSNPCLGDGLKAVDTLPIILASSTASTSVASLLVQLNPVIRIPMKLSSLSEVNAAEFTANVVAAVISAWPTVQAAWIVTTYCEVIRATFGYQTMLQGSVCGPTKACIAPFEPSCPDGVRQCRCPATAAARQRMKPQADAPTELQVEVSFRIPAGAVPEGDDVGLFYSKGIGAIVAALKSDPRFVKYSIDTANLDVVLGLPGGGAAPATTKVTTVTPATPPSAPTITITPAPTKGRSAATALGGIGQLLSLVLLCAALAWCHM